MAEQESQKQTLELQGVIGFNGNVCDGLILHPGDQHIIYPLGSTIVVKHLTDNTQTFLQKDGHNRSVSCLALSSTGKYLASGQESYMGFPAPVIIWDLEKYEVHQKLVLHSGKVQDLAFSPGEKYLVTLGGRDDNKLVVWDVETGEAICGSTAAKNTALTVRFLNNREDMFVSGGRENLRIWHFDLANRKIRPTECQLGVLKRVIRSISIDDNDEFMYAGTETGDVLKVSVDNSLFKKSGPAKKPFPQGANVVLRTNTGDLVVGAGDGTIAVLSNDNFKVLRKTKVAGGVTSLALNAAGDHFFVGTKSCNIYLVNLDSFEYELRNTCHFDKINDIAYPRGYSELFATCSKNDIRVWHARTRNELLRIQVPGLTCLCVAFMPDGKSIVSGWSDGKIRAFRPQTGKLMYAINDAHRDGVTAIACTSDCCHIVSGGEAGQVRVWEIQAYTTKMKASMKEHRGPVNSIKISADDEKCVSASSDGSCIQWNLNTFVRMTCLFASTQFQAVVYHPDQSQLLTTGSDRKLTYWDVVDGIPIRIIDGSQTAQLNTLDITEDGSTFASGGGEKIVQVWGYDDGYHYYSGVGHSGDITAVQFSPDQQTVVSVGEEGAIFLWTSPKLPELDE